MTATAMNGSGAAPEVKSAVYDSETRDTFHTYRNAVEGFREVNDRRLTEIERRGTPDVLTVDHVQRLEQVVAGLETRMNEQTLKANRPHLGGETRAIERRGSVSGTSYEHKRAFEGYMRSGMEVPLRQLEEKALSVSSGPDGGYTVPIELETYIMTRLANISPIRQIAGNRQVSSPSFQKAFSPTGPQGGWVAETSLASITNSPPLQQMSFPTMELYAMPSATQNLLDDSVVDIETWLAGEIDTVFAVQEGAAFVNGTGTNMPKGFLAYPTVQDANYSWGNIGYLATGVAGAFPSSNPSDILVSLVYELFAGYRQNATWVMSRKTQAVIRQMKDTQGHYLWQPPASLGQSASLINFPLVEAEDMPQIATGSFSVAFGDFRRGYLVVDRIGLRLLRDPYSAKPFVLFYTTKRVGGGVQDFNAIKLLKFDVS
jgi:HK97 family phage major capsid protein